MQTLYHVSVTIPKTLHISSYRICATTDRKLAQCRCHCTIAKARSADSTGCRRSRGPDTVQSRAVAQSTPRVDEAQPSHCFWIFSVHVVLQGGLLLAATISRPRSPARRPPPASLAGGHTSAGARRALSGRSRWRSLRGDPRAVAGRRGSRAGKARLAAPSGLLGRTAPVRA